MAIVDFMSVSSVKGTFAPQVNSTQKSQDENLEVAEAFAGFMNQAGQALNQMVDQASSAMDAEVSSVQSVASSYDRYSYKENQIEDAKVTTVDEKLEESAETLEQAEAEVVDAIREEYGVSEEEIQELLDSMGLSVLDLLNPKNLVNFIMQLTGTASAEELLLDDSFLQILGTMDSISKNLMQELHVDANGLQELVDLMKPVENETELPAEFAEVVDAVLEQQDTQNVEETDAKSVESNIKTVDEAVQNVEETDAKSVESNVKIQIEDTNEAVLNQNTTEQDSFATNQNSEGNELLNQNTNAEQMVVNQQVGTVAGQTADVSQTAFASYYGTDTMQIIEQIVQQMRVTLSPERTSMEMQLNPENLGKVFVRISSEEGVVNAQFHATNEVVKEALETQIATLRENLNQAGVKVDAIEVTIASHEFERNLEQDQQNPEETIEGQEVQTNKRRNLSIDSLDELAGMMTEEETLVAQMMKENGNSVDFTA